MTTIELRNLKIAKFASEETLCFEATVYFDGKKAGTVSNDGRGGCNRYFPYAVEETLNAHAATLPAEVARMGATLFVHVPDADTVINSLVQDIDLRKQFDRSIGSRVLFVRGNDVFETKAVKKDALANILRSKDRATFLSHFNATEILNLLPRDEAFRIWRKCVERESAPVETVPNAWGRAWDKARRMMREAEGLEPTSALKQAASDVGIAEGEDMAQFVTWAHRMIEEGAL